MTSEYTTIIIGGGAAGMLCAALLSSRKGEKTLLLEKMEKPLRKVRITGKGRCNLTNNCSAEELLKKVRSGEEFLKYALDSFSTKDCISYFEKIGVKLTVERGGRVFPSSMRAQEIADKLEAAVKRNKCEIQCHAQVLDVEKCSDGRYSVTYKTGRSEVKVLSTNLVVATGGVSYPSTGSTGDGYRFAHNLGHKIEPVRPSLVPLNIECNSLKELNRLVLKNVALQLKISGKIVASEFGELEFFEYGIGGAIVLRISRMAVDALIDHKPVSLAIDLKSALSEAKLLGRFEREVESDRGLTIQALFRKLMPSNIAKVVLKTLKFRANTTVSMLSIEERKAIIAKIKNLEFKVTGYGGFDKAIITAGGIDLSDVDEKSMESKKDKNLYFIGEVLDIDADTGGYNLQLAFSTAFVAAKSVSACSK